MDAKGKNQVASLLILQKIAEGLSSTEALDAVCGAGTSERLASDLWEELRERQGFPVEK